VDLYVDTNVSVVRASSIFRAPKRTLPASPHCVTNHNTNIKNVILSLIPVVQTVLGESKPAPMDTDVSTNH
jgi:hypothetical protein